MDENKNDIFQSLTDKLEEKNFQFNEAHWQAAEKMIPSSNSFWNPKWTAGIGSAIIISGVIGYSLLTENTVEKQIVETSVELPKEVEIIENKTPQKELVVDDLKEEIVIKPITKPQEKKPVAEIEKIEVEKELNIEKVVEIAKESTQLPEKELEAELVMTEEEFVEFIEVNDLKNKNTSLAKVVENNIVVISPIVPNIFTPNNDGQNDYFEIKNLEGSNWNLLIFDQSGEIVFETKEYNNRWDGEAVGNGRYIYKLFNTESNYQSSGLVELKR